MNQKFLLTIPFVSILALLLLSGCGKREDELKAFKEVFSKDQQKEMGLKKLSKKQKIALADYVVNLKKSSLKPTTTRVKGEAVDNHRDRIALPPPLPSGRSPKIYSLVGGSHWVKKVMDRGEYIVLEDNSMWQVAPIDKINSMLWLPAESIAVSNSYSGTPGYSYRLLNSSSGNSVHAKYLGKQ